jgi:signal transduction histidine kinase
MEEPEKVDALLQAFERFCEETARIEASYKSLKAEFKETNDKLESILSHISQGLLFIDLEGTILTFNRAAELLLGKVRKETEGIPFAEVFEDTLFGFSMQDALNKRAAPPYARISLGDADLDVEINFLLTESLKGMIVTLRDRTEFERLELLASRHDRMVELGEMAAEVAHEIRNPLGGIKGFAALLKRDLQSQPELQKMADLIVEGTDQLNGLVTQVLDYSRPVKPHFSRLKLAELIEEVKALIDLDSNLQPKPEFAIHLKPPSLEIFADEGMIKGALLNLFVNSCQAMPQGGSLKVEGRLEKHTLVLEISDTGVGIPKERRKKIFSPFFTTKTGGTGLGLAEVHKIVQAHAGHIDVISKEGRGTTFRIILPQKM